MAEPDYGEFTDPRHAALYDLFNPLGRDAEFFCDGVSKLAPSVIVDLGCGTGLLTCELAKRGYDIVGIDPADAMLALARSKPYADKVEWMRGSFERLVGLRADLILMTSHVAQFFLEDETWRSALEAARAALQPKGHLLFDSGSPVTRPWEKWSRETSLSRAGQTERWFQLCAVDGKRVRYRVHYHLESGEHLVSDNEIVYRSAEEITQSLERAGFALQNIYGNWDRTPLTSRSPEMLFHAVASPATP